MPAERIDQLAESVVSVVCDLADTMSARLLAAAACGEWPDLERGWKDQRNYVSSFDLELHEAYKRRIAGILPSFIYASEEQEAEIISGGSGDPPELIVVVDPLDTSELAVRGLFAYTHILVYSVPLQAPVVAVVGDMFHSVRAYYAFRDASGRDNAYLRTRGGEVFPLRPSRDKRLETALVTNYLMRPADRFPQLASQNRLLSALSRADEHGVKRGRIGVDFGSVGLCHVAAGFTDAMIEIAKGFALWDLWPGQYILGAAGGYVCALDGRPLSVQLRLSDRASISAAMSVRQKFVAAGNETLAREIVRTLA